MTESEEFIFPLDNLFFDRPVVHKVNPLQQNAWHLDAAPSVSQIPATQDIQKEAECLSAINYSQKVKKFLPPFRRPIISAVKVQRQTDETDGQEMFGVRTAETPVYMKHAVSGGDQACPSILQKFSNVAETRSSSSPQFRSRLFKAPTRKAVESFRVSGTARSPTSDHSFSGVAMATDHPPTTRTVGTCSPFMEPGQTEDCSSPQQKRNAAAKRAQIIPLTPKPIHIQGDCLNDMCTAAKFRNVFKEFPYFNCVQSKALDDLLYTSKNFVACAPTGSGKTVLFELAIIRLLMETTEPWNNVKAVYMAPIKALCSQRYEDWKLKFGPLGLNSKELTGDTEIDDFFEIQDSHLIMTTPEKWDSMTRRWRDNCLMQSVQLILIDEIHVVKDLSRGPTLEVVVSRMKAIHSYCLAKNPDQRSSMRFVAVSATVPNVCDIADWLSDGQCPATCLEMDESHRPVKLRKVVLGFPCGNNQNEFRFDLSLSYKMAGIIQTYSDQKPTLVFCSTRKGVQQSAALLAKDARFIMSIDHRQRCVSILLLMTYASSLLDSKLRGWYISISNAYVWFLQICPRSDLIMCGVGYHHAGVSVSDRKVVEDAFTAGDLPVLFTTSTLAMGVNLPAHLVVIKSTMHYVGGSYEEYSEADMLQMIGRAGRPQFDTSATAVIMTRSHTRDKYMQLMNGSDTIESSLHTNLVEHLNAEIVLHTISNVNMALDWVRSTFLYIRALKNPAHYGFSTDLDKCGIETKLQETGKLMARYFVAFDTMKQFSKVTGRETLSELIEMISKCKEFSDVQLRVSEKRTLNTLNKDKNRGTIRYPMEGKIKSNDMKVNCLIQAQLGCIPIQEFGLTQDTGKIFRNGFRVSKCLAEFLSHHSKKNFSSQLNSLILAKCFRAKLWENSLYVSKQLDKIGLSLATAMVNAGLTSFSKIEATNARELELIVNRHPPFGNQIREAVTNLPKYEIRLEQLPRYSVSTADILVTVNLKNFEQLLIKRTAPDYHYVTLIIGDSDNNMVFQQKIQDTLLLKSGSWSRKIEVAKRSQGDEISINLISSEYVGLDIQQKFSPFFYGAKTFRTESYSAETRDYELQKMQETPQRATDPHMVTLNAQTRAQRDELKSPTDNGDPVLTEPGKRKCNHFCKNKELCGHECCKVGVQLVKRPLNPESNISSHLRDLKMWREKLIETPVKRLKMRMNAEAESSNLQQFTYKRKDAIPAHARYEEHQYYSQTASHSMEPELGLTTPAETSYDGYSEHPKGFYSDMEDIVDEQAFQTTNNIKLPNAYMRGDDSERLTNRIPSNGSRAYTTSSHQDHSTDSSFSSDALNVTFHLELDEWDDFDDANLVLASNVPYTENQETRPTDCWTSNPPVCAESKPTSSRAGPAPVASQTRTSPALSAPITKHPATKQNDAGTVSMGHHFDFFSKRDRADGEQKAFGGDRMEKNEEINMFLGIFDGIF
ncbi:hypothetical protein NFI96_017657 [Prochilodus magdalenae]|nr:hypothetical protein NFI96_017657 [Prochilodus magdalenae]